LIAVALLACGDPPECVALCDAAVALQEDCLAADGLGWESIGETGAVGFRDACETWVWAERRLLRDAAASGGTIAGACQDRAATLLAPDAGCDDLAGWW
jgi:hypothetical protein